MLGNVISAEDQKVYESVEKLRLLGREWRGPNGEEAAFDKMVAEVKSYEPKHLLGVARAFTHFLAIANSAESHHRVRRLRQRLKDVNSDSPLSPKEDSCAGSISLLLNKYHIPPEEIMQSICSQSVEIVLTGKK
jgi:phosphoenolpyruvate carboxylase